MPDDEFVIISLGIWKISGGEEGKNKKPYVLAFDTPSPAWPIGTYRWHTKAEAKLALRYVRKSLKSYSVSYKSLRLSVESLYKHIGSLLAERKGD